MTDVFIVGAYTLSAAFVFIGTAFILWGAIEFQTQRGDKDITRDVRTLVFFYAINVIIMSVTGYSHVIDAVRFN